MWIDVSSTYIISTSTNFISHLLIEMLCLWKDVAEREDETRHWYEVVMMNSRWYDVNEDEYWENNRNDDKNEWRNDEIMNDEISNEKADFLDDLKKIKSFMNNFSNKNLIKMTIEEFKVMIKMMQ